MAPTPALEWAIACGNTTAHRAKGGQFCELTRREAFQIV